MYIQIKKIHGDYYCLYYICIKTYVYIDVKKFRGDIQKLIYLRYKVV